MRRNTRSDGFYHARGADRKALQRRGWPRRVRKLADAAVCIADGGRVLSDLAVLRDQAELYGPVASDATLWRALEEIGDGDVTEGDSRFHFSATFVL